MEEHTSQWSEEELGALFARALAGELDDQTAAVLRRTMAERGVDLTAAEFPGGLAALPPMPGIDVPTAWAAMVAQEPTLQPHPERPPTRLGVHDTLHIRGTPESHRIGGALSYIRRLAPSRTVIGLAATLVLCVVGVVGLVVALSRSGVFMHASEPAVARWYATRIGQRATVILADGSRVTLAPQTTLRVLSGFGARARTVSLDGEAYFEVMHATGAPFLVHAGDVTARVLGTTFDVQHYPEDAAPSVAVVSGKIVVSSLRGAHPDVTLTAGMTGTVTDSAITTSTSTDSVNTVGWIDGQLIFHKAPASAVLAALTRWYGYQFRLADSSLVNARLTLWISTESSTAALRTLKQVMNVDLAFDHDVVVVSPRRRGNAAGETSRDGRRHDGLPNTEVGR